MQARQQISRAITAVCTARLKRLDTIVLTGSLARDEASFEPSERGWRCAGDVEFLLVFAKKKFLPAAEELKTISDAINARLCSGGLECLLAPTVVTRNYFTQIKPHIFGYELRRCGEVLWGNHETLSMIPKFTAAEIPLEDAWRLLANRMIELLECTALSDLGSERTVSPALAYRTAKLYLDMATSFLAFQGSFEAGYRRRAEILNELTIAEHPFASLEMFKRCVKDATLFKVGVHRFFSCNLDAVASAISDAQRLWAWELSKLSGTPGMFPKQAIARKLRGWAYVVRQCGWHRSWRQWPRWAALASRVSPRYAVYRAASGLLVAMSEALKCCEQREVDIVEIRSWLPMVRQKPSDWRTTANEIAWNYHQFLEWTTA